MGQNKAMKVYYEEPKLTLSSLELEGFLCASGEPKCFMSPICADVEGYEDANIAEYDAGVFNM